MSRILRHWNAFWFDEVEGLPLGLFRIGVGLSGLYAWGAQAVLLPEYYADGGQFPIRLARAWWETYISVYGMPDWLGSPEAVAVLLALQFGVLVAFTIGWRLRVTTTLAFVLLSWFQARNATFLNGGDDVLRLSLFYLMLAYWAIGPARRALSVDRVRWLAADGTSAASGGAPASFTTEMPAWPLRLIQIQVGLVYLEAGFWKLWSPEWWDGSALYLALASPTFSRFGMPDWAWLEIPFTVLTIAVAWWEFLFPLLVVWERTRRFALAFGVFVHGGIALGMNIGVFPYLMIASYAVFLRGDEIRGSAVFQFFQDRIGRFLKPREGEFQEVRVG